MKWDTQQLRHLLKARRDVPHSDGTMMCRPMLVPSLDECTCTGCESIPAVRVSYFEDRARLALTFCRKQSESILPVLEY